MAELTYVCLYASYLEALEPYTDSERGRILWAMLNYAFSGKDGDFTGNERYLWPTLRSQIDRDRRAYEEKCLRNRINGCKGGRPRKETQGFFGEPEKAKEMEKNIENSMDKESKTGVFPRDGDVLAYCRRQGITPDLPSFYRFYETMVRRMPQDHLPDWKQALEVWAEAPKKSLSPDWERDGI